MTENTEVEMDMDWMTRVDEILKESVSNMKEEYTLAEEHILKRQVDYIAE